MNKQKMKLVTLLLIVTLLFSNACTVAAASKNVTKTYRKTVSKMLGKLDDFLGKSCDQYHVFKYDIYTRTAIACSLNYVWGHTIKEVNKMCAKDMKLYFGTTKMKFEKFKGYERQKNPAYLYRNKGGKVIYIGGDWGEYIPKGKVIKIVQKNSNKFEVKYNMYLYEGYGKNRKKLGYMGTYKITLRKVKNQNGFIITDMKLTKKV